MAAPTPTRRAMPGQLAELALTHVATFAFPLVFAVVCGRTLGIHDYGVVSFYAALGGFLGMIIEFGFDWYGTREVARRREDAAHGHRTLWNITATKLLLCATVASGCGALLGLIRPQDEWPLMLASLAYLVGFALDAGWYVRALEQTRLLLAITTGVRLLGVLVLVTVVPRVATMTCALSVYALVSLATSGLTWFHLLRRGLARRARIDAGTMGRLLRGSWAIVFGNVNGAMLTNGGIALLGLHADPATVGAANLALRVRMAGQATLLPLQQLGFVRISALAARSPDEALAFGRKLMAATLVVGVGVAALCMLAAPHIVGYVFHEEKPVAVMLVLLLALSVPIQGIANLFGQQTLIALGRERRYALIQTAATLVFCALLAGLTRLSQRSAYGWAIVGAESTVLLLSALMLVLQPPRARAAGPARVAGEAA
ncbi:oligosaccharide flippase family protein [Sphaerotilus uruguayifluvii]|uniref:O-antigen/teichoic acid export membrane protein n=1 Tax=Sphaerotilus uruguayifluvii TaxID=2735897 RepID=A0ABX2FWR3_9BURK|nr:O-antigen/teichoic acid export membrane protein [Leptothrix sp. C29]